MLREEFLPVESTENSHLESNERLILLCEFRLISMYCSRN